MSEKRTVVKRPAYGYPYGQVPSDLLIEVGPRQDVRPAQHHSLSGADRTLGEREVFVNGEKIGKVYQAERRGEQPISRGARIVRITGWPIEWWPQSTTVRLTNRYSSGYGHTQMNQAVYHLVAAWVKQQERSTP